MAAVEHLEDDLLAVVGVVVLVVLAVVAWGIWKGSGSLGSFLNQFWQRLADMVKTFMQNLNQTTGAVSLPSPSSGDVPGSGPDLSTGTNVGVSDEPGVSNG